MQTPTIPRVRPLRLWWGLRYCYWRWACYVDWKAGNAPCWLGSFDSETGFLAAIWEGRC